MSVAGGMHGRRHAWQGTCVVGGMHVGGGVCGGGCVRGGRHSWQGVCMAGDCMVGDMHFRDMCGGGCAWWGACVAGEMATAADGMHPTGMHSCFTGVCQSFCPREVCMMSLPVWLPGPVFLSGGGVSVRETPPDTDSHCTVKSGRYASYWNAFLLTFILNLKVLSLF